jgi:hypothetical protein
MKAAKWSKADIELMFHEYPNTQNSAAKLEEIFHRPYTAIKQKACQLGLKLRLFNRAIGEPAPKRIRANQPNCQPIVQTRTRTPKKTEYKHRMEEKRLATIALKKAQRAEANSIRKAVRIDAKTVIFVPAGVDPVEYAKAYRERQIKKIDKKYELEKRNKSLINRKKRT